MDSNHRHADYQSFFCVAVRFYTTKNRF